MLDKSLDFFQKEYNKVMHGMYSDILWGNYVRLPLALKIFSLLVAVITFPITMLIQIIVIPVHAIAFIIDAIKCLSFIYGDNSSLKINSTMMYNASFYFITGGQLQKIINKLSQMLQMINGHLEFSNGDNIEKTSLSAWDLFARIDNIAANKKQEIFDSLIHLDYLPQAHLSILSRFYDVVLDNHNDELIKRFSQKLCKLCLRYDVNCELNKPRPDALFSTSKKLVDEIVSLALEATDHQFEIIATLLQRLALIYSQGNYYTMCDYFLSILDKLGNKFTDAQIISIKNAFWHLPTNDEPTDANNLFVAWKAARFILSRLGRRLDDVMNVDMDAGIVNAPGGTTYMGMLGNIAFSEIGNNSQLRSGLNDLIFQVGDLKKIRTIGRICKLLGEGNILTLENGTRVVENLPFIKNIDHLLGESPEITQDKFEDILDRAQINTLLEQDYQAGSNIILPDLSYIVTSYLPTINEDDEKNATALLPNINGNENHLEEKEAKLESIADTLPQTSTLLNHQIN
jgi:hypothetical protein